MLSEEFHVSASLFERCFTYLMCEFHVYAGPAPDQLQKALRKTFSAEKKSKIRKAWDGTKVIYNVASWGATAVGVYNN
ncbi:MADS box interactor-like [Zea mays]|uniref:MADS box interactor-like n=1 Tax=Zea mays TaxID=4577 RepID=A0A1D6PIQ5_MAIZE|nr:MADS box interactor-like [Zea mays]